MASDTAASNSKATVRVKIEPVEPPFPDRDRWCWVVYFGGPGGRNYCGYTWWRWWAQHRANKRVRQIRRAYKRQAHEREVAL